MSKIILTNAKVLVNSVDYSSLGYSIDVQSSRAEVDVSSFGDTAIEILLGLADVTFVIGFFNDYNVGSLDQALFALHQTNTPFPVEVRPTNVARSTSNPAYFLTGALLPEYHPINGDMGSASTTEISFRNSNQAGLTRLTA